MTYTWKVTYYLPPEKWTGANILGVAFVEAATRSDASFCFQQQYAGQFSTINKIEKIG